MALGLLVALSLSGCTLGQQAVVEPSTARVVVLGATGTVEGRRAVNEVRAAVADVPTPETWQVEVVAEDDQNDPTRTAEIVARLSDDDELLMVVGPLRDGDAVSAASILGSDAVVQITPMDTATSLTRGAIPDKPLRPFDTLFRPVANDDAQAALMAVYVVDTLSKPKVWLVSDGSSRATSQVSALARELKARGAEATPVLEVSDEASMRAAVKQLAKEKADLVYVGGAGAAAAGLSAVAGPNRGWQLITNDSIPMAGRGPEGLRIGDAASAPVTGADGDPLASGILDAAGVVGRSLTECLPGAESMNRLRAVCRDAVSQVAFTGASGAIAFDDFGDLSLPRASILRATARGWDPVLTANAQPAPR